jgi:serine/threonine-protein kinase
MARDRNTDDAQDLFSRGHKALSAGEYQEAVECFSRAIRLRPDVSAGYRYRAYAYLELGDRVRALNDFDNAIRLKPDDVQVYADRAAELFTQKAFDQAIADCDRVLKLDPGRAAVNALRGRCHAGRGDTESALTDYAAAIAGDPDEAPRYLLWRAELNLDCENYAAAEADCTEAIRRDPARAEAFHVRGTVRQQRGDTDGAIEDFTEALRLSPDHGLAHVGRAVCHFVKKDYPAAVADCDAAIRLLPNVVRCYELRGSALKHLGDLDAALANFDEAVRLAPTAVMAYNYRAGVHYARKDYAAAVRDHMEALKRDPRHAGTFNQLGWVWATCPDPDVRNGERAKECATRACELTEWAEAGFLDTLAAACAECGEFEDAVKWQEKAAGMISDPEKQADFQSRLELYHQRKPVRVEGGVVD